MRIAIGTRKGLWLAAGAGSDWTVTQPISEMAEFASVAWVPRQGSEPRLLVGARSWFLGGEVIDLSTMLLVSGCSLVLLLLGILSLKVAVPHIIERVGGG